MSFYYTTRYEVSSVSAFCNSSTKSYYVFLALILFLLNRTGIGASLSDASDSDLIRAGSGASIIVVVFSYVYVSI